MQPEHFLFSYNADGVLSEKVKLQSFPLKILTANESLIIDAGLEHQEKGYYFGDIIETGNVKGSGPSEYIYNYSVNSASSNNVIYFHFSDEETSDYAVYFVLEELCPPGITAELYINGVLQDGSLCIIGDFTLSKYYQGKVFSEISGWAFNLGYGKTGIFTIRLHLNGIKVKLSNYTNDTYKVEYGNDTIDITPVLKSSLMVKQRSGFIHVSAG